MSKKVSMIIFCVLLLLQFFLIQKAWLFPVYVVLCASSIWFLYKCMPAEQKLPAGSVILRDTGYFKADLKTLLFLAVFIFLMVVAIASSDKIPMAVQFAAIAVGILAFFMVRTAAPEKSIKENIIFDYISLAILLVVTVGTRFYLLGDKFGGVNSDEMLFSETAVSILNHGFPPSVFVGDSNNQIASPGYYMTSWFYQLFGVSTFSLRILPALGAVLAVISFYIFLRLFFRWDVALLAAVFFGFEHTYLHISRWMHVFQLTPIFVWLGFFFLVKGFTGRNRLFLIIGGGIAGWSLYFYNSNKFLVFIFGIYIIYEIIKEAASGDKREFREYLLDLLGYAGGFIIAFLPLAMYIAENFGRYFAHISEVAAKSSELVTNLGYYAGMLTVRGSANAWLNYPNHPLLTVVPALLFLVGLGMTLATLKKRESFIALILLVIGVLPGIYSTYWSPPSTQRGIIALTSSYLFIAIALNLLMNVGNKFKWIFIRAAVALMIGLVCIGEKSVYFEKMVNDSYMKLTFSNIEYDIQKAYKKNMKDKDVFVSQYFFGGTMGERPFMGYEIYFHKVKKPEILVNNPFSVDSLIMFPYGNKSVLLLVESYYKGAYEYLKERFPDVKMTVIPAGEWSDAADRASVLQPDYFDRTVEMVQFEIPYKDIKNMAGLKFQDNSGKEEAGLFDFTSASGTAVSGPGSFKGGIRIYKNGVYRLKFNDFRASSIVLDGKRIKLSGGETEKIKLFTSIHNIDIPVESVTGKETVSMKLEGDSLFQTVDFGRFVRERRMNGLRGRYEQTVINEGTFPIREDITPTIYHRWLPSAMEGRRWVAGFDTYLMAYWDGKVKIEQEGDYEFGIEGGGLEAWVYVDGKQIYQVGWIQAKDQVPIIKPIHLGRGFHTVKFKVKQYSIGMCTIGYVRMPDGKKLEPIPEAMLYY
jgi:hypothetical protein